MAASQTVLRVQTNIPDYSVTTDNGSLTINSETDIILIGNGKFTNPYSGTSDVGATIIFDVNESDGIFHYDILVADGYTQTIYLTHNGIESLIAQITGGTSFFGSFLVSAKDTVRVSLQQPVTVNSIYMVPQNTPSKFFVNLDLYGNVPIKINRSYAELQDISKRNSDYSLNFTVPGSKTNTKFFEEYYNVDNTALYFNPNARTYCEVLIDDQSVFVGYLKMNKINVMNTRVEYDVSLYSTVGNLYANIGNKLLKDLNYDDPDYTFNHTFGQSAVVNGWGYSNFSSNSEKPQPYIYPIIHNGYLYSGDTVNMSGLTVDERTHLYTSSPLGQGAYSSVSGFTGDTAYNTKQYRINSPTQGLLDNQLKPALSIWNLLGLMFKSNGYTIKSDFFNTPWMKTLYMYGYFSSNSTKFGYNLQTIATLPIDGVEVIASPYGFDNSGNRTTGFTDFDLIVAKVGTGVPCYSASDISVTVLTERLRHTDFFGQTETVYEPKTYTIVNGTSGTTVNLNQHPFSNTVYVHYYAITNCSTNVALLSALKYQPTAVNSPVLFKDGDYVNFSLVIDPNIKQIDLISSIAKKFNLLLIPNPLNINEIIIEPFNYYVGTGDIHDWSDKISYDEGFTVEPALNYIDTNLIYTDSEDGDYGNKTFKEQNNRIYGQNFIYGPTSFKSTTGTTTTIFGPEIIRQWDTIDQSPNGGIKLPLGINYAGNTAQSTQNTNGSLLTNYQYTGVKTKPKLFWYLGSANIFLDTLGEVYDFTKPYKTYLVDILNSSGTTANPTAGFDNVPLISHTMPIGLADEYKINNDSLCLLFNSEQPTYVDVQSYNCYTDNSAYNLFYGNRITNVYNPNTRHLTGKFYLKLSDYKNLKANDLIKIQNQYFIWNKINNYNLTNTELTEIELVQANNVPQKYPTRYFKYYYCDTPDTVYTIKTDFTNPNMLNTNFGWSIMYDHNMGTINTGNTVNYSGFTSMFIDDSYTGTTLHYVPYFTQEITQDEYENGDNYPWTCDTLHNHIWSTPNAPYGNLMPTYWINSNYSQTGLNLFINCADCATAISTYNIAVGSSTSFGQRICGKIIQTEATENIQNQQNKNITTQN